MTRSGCCCGAAAQVHREAAPVLGDGRPRQQLPRARPPLHRLLQAARTYVRTHSRTRCTLTHNHTHTGTHYFTPTHTTTAQPPRPPPHSFTDPFHPTHRFFRPRPRFALPPLPTGHSSPPPTATTGPRPRARPALAQPHSRGGLGPATGAGPVAAAAPPPWLTPCKACVACAASSRAAARLPRRGEAAAVRHMRAPPGGSRRERALHRRGCGVEKLLRIEPPQTLPASRPPWGLSVSVCACGSRPCLHSPRCCRDAAAAAAAAAVRLRRRGIFASGLGPGAGRRRM